MHACYMQVRVEPRSSALANGAAVAELTTRDNGDGTYTASYAVTARGDYEVIAHTCFTFLRLCPLCPQPVVQPSVMRPSVTFALLLLLASAKR